MVSPPISDLLKGSCSNLHMAQNGGSRIEKQDQHQPPNECIDCDASDEECRITRIAIIYAMREYDQGLIGELKSRPCHTAKTAIYVTNEAVNTNRISHIGTIPLSQLNLFFHNT